MAGASGRSCDISLEMQISQSWGFDIGVFGEEALRLRHINPSNSGHKKGRG